MDFNLESLIPERNRETLRRVGLHKIAGAMAGTDELTLKEATALLGAKAYLQRKEREKIAAGIAALAALQGEKLADSLPGTLLRQSAWPAAGGALAAIMPRLVSDEPVRTEDLYLPAILGATITGMGSAGLSLANAARRNPAASEALAQTIGAATRR